MKTKKITLIATLCVAKLGICQIYTPTGGINGLSGSTTNVGIGTSPGVQPNGRLEILSTTNQFRLSNTSTIFNDINTNASGYLTLMPSNATSSRIGFNTTTPLCGLHVNMGTFRLTDPLNSTRAFQVTPSYAGNGDIPSGTIVMGSSTTTNEGLSFATTGSGTLGVKLGAYAFNGTGWKSVWETANVSSGFLNLLLMKSGGNVGIGTSSPLYSAHINGDLFVTGAGGNAPGNPGIAGGATMYLGDNNTQPQWGIEYNDPNITTGSIAGGINFWRPFGSTGSGGNYVLFLKNDSRVGIHTNNPTADLTVNGNMLVGDPSLVSVPTGYKLYVQTGILTEKVKVALYTTTDWSDYVFANDYKLKSLTEVNSFINTNKHLPGVPSASELVEQGGFDLGKMDAKLLEKIEELTLYLIQLDKTNKELTERLLKLESSK